jgi:glycosyltransferase involved in cell wall biosynthesis
MGDELRELYRGAMAVMLPSRVHEVFPLITLEAMAAGKPVIGSNVGGVPEVVEDRRTGFLVKPADLHGWVEAVMRLAYDDELRVRMSREARLAVEQTFHVDRHYDRIRSIYEEVTGIPFR